MSHLAEKSPVVEAHPSAVPVVMEAPLRPQPAGQNILKSIYRMTIKLPLKRLGHAVEDWVASKSPMGNRSLIDIEMFEWAGRLESNSQAIKKELMELLAAQQEHLPNIQDMSPRQTNLSRKDGWKTYFFYAFGHRIGESYKRCPKTGRMLDSIPGLTLAFFSVLAPGMHIKRHRGSYKGVLRCHLGLIVPTPSTRVRMSVGDEMVYWQEGKCVIFDDTHKHEVWNDTDGIRVVLLLDVHRPLPKWLDRVNKTVLNLAGCLPEVRHLVKTQQKWEHQNISVERPGDNHSKSVQSFSADSLIHVLDEPSGLTSVETLEGATTRLDQDTANHRNDLRVPV